jgi:hypothetical protein
MRPPEIEAYLDAVERSAGKKFRLRSDIAALMHAADAGRIPADFAEVTFLSKFLVNAAHVLRRTGLKPEETANLSSEFAENVQQVTALVRRILAAAGPAERGELEEKFLAPTQAGLAALLDLATELSWIKNYELDRAARN